MASFVFCKTILKGTLGKWKVTIYVVCLLLLVAQLYLTLCDPMVYSPPGSTVCAILQARILEWLAIPFSRDLPDPGIEPQSPALQADSLSSESPGKPFHSVTSSMYSAPWCTSNYFLPSFMTTNIRLLTSFPT